MVELVVVIVMIGILAAVAVPRLTGGSGIDDRSFRDRTIAALRYAQKSAIASRRTVCATFPASLTDVAFNQSTVVGATDCTTSVPLSGPDGGALVVTASANARYAAQPGDVVFDASGRPNAAASIVISGLPVALAITVEAETGYVH